jgi:hypothetical protein
MYKNTSLASAAADGLSLRSTVSMDLQNEMVAASRGAPSASGFAQETQRIATLMRDQYRLGFVDVGGWDTHVNQGNVTGGLANNLRNLGEGLAAYANTLGDEWNNTTVVVVSEFGRTFRENGDHGTDHGHGTVHWVLGGKVNGGRIAGEQIAVTQEICCKIAITKCSTITATCTADCWAACGACKAITCRRCSRRRVHAICNWCDAARYAAHPPSSLTGCAVVKHVGAACNDDVAESLRQAISAALPANLRDEPKPERLAACVQPLLPPCRCR